MKEETDFLFRRSGTSLAVGHGDCYIHMLADTSKSRIHAQVKGEQAKVEPRTLTLPTAHGLLLSRQDLRHATQI